MPDRVPAYLIDIYFHRGKAEDGINRRQHWICQSLDIIAMPARSRGYLARCSSHRALPYRTCRRITWLLTNQTWSWMRYVDESSQAPCHFIIPTYPFHVKFYYGIGGTKYPAVVTISSSWDSWEASWITRKVGARETTWNNRYTTKLPRASSISTFREK